jgi:AcrR family transcriptional regulator
MSCVATFPQRKRRAPRRTSGELHQQLLDAAGTLFEAQGYRATTTQQIVDKAGVDAATLYRHFESKADLFEATMLGPLKQFLDDHAAYWSSQPLGEVDPAELMRRYATGFFTMLHEHRDTMRLLVTASADDGVLGVIADRVSRQFTEGLVVMRNIVVAESEIHGYPGLQASDATIAGATGMILSIVLFDDWIFPAGRRPDTATIIEEIIALVLYGVTQRPDEPGGSLTAP